MSTIGARLEGWNIERQSTVTETGKLTAKAEPEARKGMGRPRKKVDAKAVIDLASKSMTAEEIAASLNISHDTITRRFASELAKGRELCNASLRRKQFQRAMAGSEKMLIHLGKNRLGQKDAVEHEHTGLDGGPMVHTIRFGDGKRDE